MTRLTTAAFFVLLLNIKCSNGSSTKINRYEVIKDVVNAISKYDTLKLYQLIDTGKYFSVYSKENFIGKIDYVYERLKKCDSHIIDSAIKVEKEPVYHTKYTIALCSFPGQPNNDSFKLICSFADYRTDGLMDLIDIEVHRTIQPTVPAPAKN